MRLAAIDIGSNAIRLQVSSVLHNGETVTFKKVEYLRFPLRLGQDVFEHGNISSQSQATLLKLLYSYKLLIECYHVDYHRICATSAFREAANRQAVIARVQEELGMSICLIDGKEEEALIDKAISAVLENSCNYLHVDVGGGSTEIGFYKGKKKHAVHSFPLGSVRILAHQDKPADWQALQAWIIKQRQYFPGILIGVATGGNIRKLAQLAKKGGKKLLSFKKLAETQHYIASHSLTERIHTLHMNPDRADVIVPALKIYHVVLHAGGIEQIIVPEVSLRDGIIRNLYEQHCLENSTE